jgi:hypothetical protein
MVNKNKKRKYSIKPKKNKKSKKSNKSKKSKKSEKRNVLRKSCRVAVGKGPPIVDKTDMPDGDRGEALTRVADILIQEGKAMLAASSTASARSKLYEAIRVAPGHRELEIADILVDIGIARMRDDPIGSRLDFQTALRLDPDYDLAHEFLDTIKIRLSVPERRLALAKMGMSRLNPDIMELVASNL